jgi:hypothetical protein
MVNNMKKIIVLFIAVIFLGSSYGYAGEYLSSAHGTQNNAITGVERLSAYTDGNCGHCHEQHSSIDGSEPTPTSGPDNYLLFAPSHTIQTNNFCYYCHVDTASQQTGGVLKNYSYTYRAGNYDDSSGNDDIKQAFSASSTSSHNLDSIVTFITGKWGYTADSNPCCGCHNPHAAQGDPAGSSSAKSSSTRGYPVSKPSLHATLTSWGLWGDASGEKMIDYTSYYQAPYRNGSTTTYEPDGSSTTTNGSNLTDFVTFCQDCHSDNMVGAPYNLSHTPIDWSTFGTGESGGDKHGKKVATQDGAGSYVNLIDPYSSAWGSSNGLVLACTDCHEAHGAPSVMLIRKEVNGAALSNDINSMNSTAWVHLCSRCHDISLGAVSRDIHHDNTGAPYPGPPTG